MRTLYREGKKPVTTTLIDDVECVRVSEMARLLRKNNDAIRRLIYYGNKFRKMEIIRTGTTVWIPVREIEDYPFSLPGRQRTFVVRYTIQMDGKLKSYIQSYDEVERAYERV